MGQTGKDTQGPQEEAQFQGSLNLDDNLGTVPLWEGPLGGWFWPIVWLKPKVPPGKAAKAKRASCAAGKPSPLEALRFR